MLVMYVKINVIIGRQEIEINSDYIAKKKSQMKAFELFKENRTLIKNRKLSYVVTAEKNIKFIWTMHVVTMNLIST